jgi:hypothetical protein
MVARKTHPWYSFDKLLSYNAKFNIVAGPRGTGKTFDAKRRSIKKALRDPRDGEQFIYLRRWKTELAPARRTFFNDVAEQFPEWDFRPMGVEAQASHESTRGEKKREWHTIGYFVALSQAQTQKSVSFARVTTIIYDEFIAEHGRQYLPDEVSTFLGFYSTVDRNQDKTKVLFCANSVSTMNPYFIEWEIRPDTFPEICTIRGGFVAVHFPPSSAFKASVYETQWGKFIQGTQFGDYAVENSFEDAHDLLIDIKPASARHQFNLETKYGTMSVWYDRKPGEYYIQKKLPGQSNLNLTLLPEKMEPGKQLVMFNDKLLAYLRTAFRTGKVTFDQPSTRNAFVEIGKR